MANRKRNIQMKFWVTEEEKRLIDEKMKLLPTQRYGAYLRNCPVDSFDRRRPSGGTPPRESSPFTSDTLFFVSTMEKDLKGA